MIEDKDKINKLERTVLELGSEIYRLKSNMSALQDNHEKFVKIMEGLRTLLDDKGVIVEDDFDSAVDLKIALEGFQCNTSAPLGYSSVTRTKKDFH